MHKREKRYERGEEKKERVQKRGRMRRRKKRDVGSDFHTPSMAGTNGTHGGAQVRTPNVLVVHTRRVL